MGSSWTWRKSSASDGPEGACVETAWTGETVLVRARRPAAEPGTLFLESTRLKVPAGLEWPAAAPRGRGRGGSRGGRGAPYARAMTQSTDLGPEDRKIVTLARSARARNGVPEGAAVRDETGRTYVAGTVDLESLRLSALRTAVAMAVASGAESLEAAAVVSGAQALTTEDLAAVRDLGGAGTPVFLAGPDGEVRVRAEAG
ncbi:DUF397 domain-containing protein [Streptomyces sp. G44]|nr:DUF397 domain-containing protein [Streptomyces sp. G44]